MFQSSSALGVSDASASACILSVPTTSTSQADGIRFSLIMLIMVQGTTPKYSSRDVQHCTALIVVCVCCIHCSITQPSLAIFINAGSGTEAVFTFFLMAASLASTLLSPSF